MMAAVMGTFLVIILIIVMVLLISCVKIVRQAQALVIERLGAYQATWGTGLHFKLPIVDRVARRVDMKEQVVDFAPQPVITKDNVTMRIDTVVFYQITDPKMFCYGVANPIMAIENLTATMCIRDSRGTGCILRFSLSTCEDCRRLCKRP